MKRFFNVNDKYKFEFGDFCAFGTLINVMLILYIGLAAAYVGITVAIIGFVYNLVTTRRINTFITNFALIILNFYFLLIK